VIARAAATLLVAVSVGAPASVVPPGFQGVSLEARQVPALAADGSALRAAFGLIRAPGTPLRLRIGGETADEAWWEGLREAPRPGTFPVGAAWLRSLGTLARLVPSRVTVTTNLAADAPVPESGFAQAARAAMPRGALGGVEIGNEPDLYSIQSRLDPERPMSPDHEPWTFGYSPSRYEPEFQAYEHALWAKLPGVPLEGPDTTSSALPWLYAAIGQHGRSIQVIGVHRYPLSYCLPRRDPSYPSPARLLSNRSTTSLANSLSPAVRVAAAVHARVVVSEFNAVSCPRRHTGAVAGSFATALWGLDALFSFVRVGVSATEWHVRPQASNAPFGLTTRGIEPRPELYAMALFASLDAPGSRLLDTWSVHRGSSQVKVWAVSRHHQLTVLLINKTHHASTVSLSFGHRPAPALRMRRLLATPGGARYGGRRIGTDARWHGRVHSTVIRPVADIDTIRLPPLSAANLQGR
jgi:hypothetical protein